MVSQTNKEVLIRCFSQALEAVISKTTATFGFKLVWDGVQVDVMSHKSKVQTSG